MFLQQLFVMIYATVIREQNPQSASLTAPLGKGAFTLIDR